MLNIQLYNKAKNTSGYIGADGLIKHDQDDYWSVTDFMQVTPGSRCSYNGISYAVSDHYAAYYDIHYNFIDVFKINASETSILIPKDVYYVKFSLCKQTKINQFSTPLEVGSINNASGTNEDGANFKRSDGYVTVEPNTKYTMSTTKATKQMSLYFYHEAQDHTMVYDSYASTAFNVDVQTVKFTTPNNSTGLRAKFYDPEDIGFNVMLNLGETAIPYSPYTDINNDDTNTFQFFIYAEAFEGFRSELYEWMKETLSPNLTEGDLDIIIKLMCYIFGDLSGLVYNLKDQIDPDLAEEAYLRHLGSVIGYEWNKGLIADEQRESIKAFIELQKKRGTDFSLKNLIAVFGQTKNSYYSSSDLRGVRIICGGKNGEPVGTEDANGLYPGDVMIEIPAFSNILIDAIDNIRLIGTRLFFTYVIYNGPFKIGMEVNAGEELNMFFDPAYWGYDPTIEEFTNIVEEETGSDVIGNITDWFLLHQRVQNCMANAACAVYISTVAPFDKGFIWNVPGNQRYHGFLLEDSTLKEDDTMYGYKGW